MCPVKILYILTLTWMLSKSTTIAAEQYCNNPIAASRAVDLICINSHGHVFTWKRTNQLLAWML